MTFRKGDKVLVSRGDGIFFLHGVVVDNPFDGYTKVKIDQSGDTLTVYTSCLKHSNNMDDTRNYLNELNDLS